jgi:hypothetical protein
LAIAADHQWNFQERGFVELVAMHAVSRHGAVPETGEHQRVSGLTLREIEFWHGLKIDG